MELFAFDPPELKGPEVSAILAEHWSLGGEHERLRGERSHNSSIVTPDGERFVLHVVSASERPDVVDLQTTAMRHLEARAGHIPVPRVVPTVAGAPTATVERDGATHVARLLTYLPGVPFDPSQELPTSAYRSVGELLGRVAAALADLTHPAADHVMPWDIANGLILDDELRSSVRHPGVAALVEEMSSRLAEVADTMARLPRALIHNDGHADNLLRHDASSSQVCGLIDFGDVVRTVRAADVAIAAESFATGHRDPHRVLAEIAAGYHVHVPLDDAEIEALPDLVLARAVLGLLLADHQIAHAPHLAAQEADLQQDRLGRTRAWAALDRDRLADAVRAEIERTDDHPAERHDEELP